jgi:hypothetical protein
MSTPLVSLVFGEEGQIEVVGWSGNKDGKGDKLYILKCNKCSKDSELFGEGYFRSTKGNLVKGAVPCGCSKSPGGLRSNLLCFASEKLKNLVIRSRVCWGVEGTED